MRDKDWEADPAYSFEKSRIVFKNEKLGLKTKTIGRYVTDDKHDTNGWFILKNKRACANRYYLFNPLTKKMYSSKYLICKEYYDEQSMDWFLVVKEQKVENDLVVDGKCHLFNPTTNKKSIEFSYHYGAYWGWHRIKINKEVYWYNPETNALRKELYSNISDYSGCNDRCSLLKTVPEAFKNIPSYFFKKENEKDLKKYKQCVMEGIIERYPSNNKGYGNYIKQIVEMINERILSAKLDNILTITKDPKEEIIEYTNQKNAKIKIIKDFFKQQVIGEFGDE